MKYTLSLEAKMIEAIDKYEQAKITFKWVTEAFTHDDDGAELTDRVALVDAKRRAKADPIRQDSIDQCAFWSNEAIMYAAAISALRG